MHRSGMVSIWFFIGVLLLVYGFLIAGAGLWELTSPPEHPVVMAGIHANIWWGILLIGMGAFYTLKFSPKKGNQK